jgi:uncharacterized protein YbjQ (UPF0145 family)
MDDLLFAYLQNQEFILTVVLLILGFVVGNFFEKRHMKSIKAREKFFFKMPAVTMRLKKILPEPYWGQIESTRLVVGTVVISPDYFRHVLGGIINILGGQIGSYESVLDRARREAILRMKEAAPMADIIVNTHLAMDELDPIIPNLPIRPLALYAYGTAVRLKKSSDLQTVGRFKSLVEVS